METYSTKIFYIRGKILFPYCTLSVILNKSELTMDIKTGDKILAYPVKTALNLVLYRNKIATLTVVLEKTEDEKTVKLLLKGLIRVRLKKINKLQHADFTIIDEENIHDIEQIGEDLRKKAQELIFLINVEESDRLINLISYLTNIHQMADFISHYFIMKPDRRFKLYRETNIHKRSQNLLEMLDTIIANVKKKQREQDT